MSVRAHQGLLQPTVRQSVRLGELLEAQRVLYNAALEELRGAWRWQRRTVNRFDQFRQLTGWDDPMLRFGVTAARGTLTRLDRASGAFYRRAQAGQRAGFPRFKSQARFDSVEYPDSRSWQIDGNRLYLQEVGQIRFHTSRRGIRGTPKTLTLRREGKRWRLTVFCTNVAERRLEPTGRQVGIDVGVTELVATSDGKLVPNPRWLGRSQQRKVARQRRDAHHQLSRHLVNRHDLIVHEKLNIVGMTRRPRPRHNADGGFDPNGAAAKAALNREILNAGWGQLLRMIAYKAEEAGRQLIAVDPATPPAPAINADTSTPTAEPAPHSVARRAATGLTPTSTPHATSFGPGWPIATTEKPHEQRQNTNSCAASPYPLVTRCPPRPPPA